MALEAIDFERVSIHSRLNKPGECGRVFRAAGRMGSFNPLPTK